MHNLLSSRKIIWVFAAVGVLAVLFVLAAGLANKKDLAGRQTTPTPKFAVTQQDIDSTKLPDKFPVGFPQETGAKITQNYQATAPDGRQQSTRTFESAKSLDENLKIYQDYFKKNNWTINDTNSAENYRSILASKDGLLIQVAIDQNASKVVTVNTTIIPQAASSSTPK